MLPSLLSLLIACEPDARRPEPAQAQSGGSLPAAEGHLIAEHARTLSEVFFLDSGRHEMGDIIGGIVAATPAYTQVNYFSASADVPAVVSTRAHRIIPDTLPKSARAQAQFWTQDSFQVITRADQTRTILLPAGEHLNEPATAALDDLGYGVKTSALHWEGGNMVTDVIEGRSTLYIGYTIYEGQSERAENPGVAPEAVLETLAAEFEVDEVVRVPYVTGNLFHLDQIFLITAPGEVVVHSVVLEELESVVASYLREENNYFSMVFFESNPAPESPEARDSAYLANLPQLQDYALQHAQKMHTRLGAVASLFVERGYTVHRLPADPRMLWDRLSLVNGIPYIDKQTQQKTVLLPEYTNHKRSDFADQLAAKVLLERLGHEVRFVPVLTGSGSGGPHCLSNVGW